MRWWSGVCARGNEMCPFGVSADLGPRLTVSAADHGKYRDIVIFAMAGNWGSPCQPLPGVGLSVDSKAAVEFLGLCVDPGSCGQVCRVRAPIWGIDDEFPSHDVS